MNGQLPAGIKEDSMDMIDPPEGFDARTSNPIQPSSIGTPRGPAPK